MLIKACTLRACAVAATNLARVLLLGFGLVCIIPLSIALSVPVTVAVSTIAVSVPFSLSVTVVSIIAAVAIPAQRGSVTQATRGTKTH